MDTEYILRSVKTLTLKSLSAIKNKGSAKKNNNKIKNKQTKKKKKKKKKKNI